MQQAPLCGLAPRRCRWQPDVCHTINLPCIQININRLQITISPPSNTQLSTEAIIHILQNSWWTVLLARQILVYKTVFIVEMVMHQEITTSTQFYLQSTHLSAGTNTFTYSFKLILWPSMMSLKTVYYNYHVQHSSHDDCLNNTKKERLSQQFYVILCSMYWN